MKLSAIPYSVLCHAEDPVGVGVIAIETEFIADVQRDHPKRRKPNRQSSDVDSRKEFVTEEVSERNSEIAQDHGR